MSNINQRLVKEKPLSKRLAEKRNAQEAEGAMKKETPVGDEDTPHTPGAIQTHPLEAAEPHMRATMQRMEQVRQILAKQYHAIEKVINTGDVSHLVDQNMANDPEAWAKKEKEFNSLFNKLLTLLPTV